MQSTQETAISFDTQGILLEGRLSSPVRERAAVVTHPHPQYGGSMDNPVVEMIARAYQACGWTTLRFNFRGTGDSQGVFDHGEGEQTDIDGAIAWLARQGVREVELAGYSFGAWVVSLWAQDNMDHSHVIRLVAPPVAFMDYLHIRDITGLAQVVVGSRDDFAPSASVREHIKTWQPNADLNIIEHADHFFQGHLHTLERSLTQRIPNHPPAAI